MRFPMLVKINDFLERVAKLSVGIDFQSKAGNPFEIFRLQMLSRVNPISIKIQRPPGFLWILDSPDSTSAVGKSQMDYQPWIESQSPPKALPLARGSH